MNNSITSSPAPRAIKSGYSSGPPGTGAGVKESQNTYGVQIAQTALQSVGGSAKDFPGTYMGNPEYAAAVSIIFTRATNQAIMLGTEPRRVLSTSGARGIVAGDSMGFGPGHIFNVINDNGTIEFIDGQKGIDGALNFYDFQNFQLLLTYPGTP